MIIRRIILLVLVVGLSACVFANGWTRVGGMALNYEWNPPADPPGMCVAFSNLTPDEDGFITYGDYTFHQAGGLRHGILSVSNSIDSYNAYITQTIPGSAMNPANGGVGNMGEQHGWWAVPTDSVGASGVWVEFSYGTGEIDRYTFADDGSLSWQHLYCSVTPDTAPLTQLTIKIGILRTRFVTTGTRTVMLEDFLMWVPNLPLIAGGYAHWDNWLFDLKPDWRENLIVLKPSSNPLMAVEQGESATYEVVCTDDYYENIPPVSDVIVTIAPDSQTEINGAGQAVPVVLTFTPANYNIPQTVSVTAVADMLVEGPHTSTITHAVSSADGAYNQAIVGPLTVDIIDNNVAGWEVVGGMSAVEVDRPSPWSPAGLMNWALGGTDNGDGTVTYGKYTFAKSGGARYCVLEVDNSIDSDAAYMTQTYSQASPISHSFHSQQALSFARPEGGATGVWIELITNNGHTQSKSWTASTDWTNTITNINPAGEFPADYTSLTIRIGVTKDPGVTTGTRSIMIDTGFIWDWANTETEWENSFFGAPLDPFDPTACFDGSEPKALENNNLVNLEEFAIIAEHWLLPNAFESGNTIGMEELTDVATDWLQLNERQFWFDNALPFRGMYAAQYGGAWGWIWDVSIADTAQWNSNLTTFSSEGYNTMVYWISSELTTGIHTFLTLDDFPEAKQISDAEAAANRANLQWLLGRGKELGMNNLLYSFAVYWTEAFGNDHGLNQWLPVDETTVSWYHNAYPPDYNHGVYTPLTSAYSSSVYSEFSRTFGDMDGFYGPIGEPVPNLRRGEFYQDGIAPGLRCGKSNLRVDKPVYIAHNWQMTLQDYLNKVANSGAYDNLWLGWHAWNGEQVCDTKPDPEIINWANQTGLPIVITIYPANSQIWLFNSPQFAAEIIAEMKEIPNIKGFVYFEMAGRLSGPLFRKALGYYASTSESYSPDPWLDILEDQFGNRTAAEHMLNAWNSSGRILPEQCAMIYYKWDTPAEAEKELTIPYVLLARSDMGAATVSPNRDMISIHSCAATIASNPGYNFGTTITPPQQMAMIKALGQTAFDEATAAMPYVTTNLSEAQDVLAWMEGFKLMTVYYELKVNAAIAALIYKQNHNSAYKTQAINLANQAYTAYIAASNHLIAEVRPIFESMYGFPMKMLWTGSPTLEQLQANELSDRDNIGSIMGAW